MKRDIYYYEQAVDYLKNHGVGCDPAADPEGEYVCDLLDDMVDGYDEYDEPFYYKGTLQTIIGLSKDYLEE